MTVEVKKKQQSISVPESPQMMAQRRGAFQDLLQRREEKLYRPSLAYLGNPSCWDCVMNLGLHARLLCSYLNPLPFRVAQNA